MSAVKQRKAVTDDIAESGNDHTREIEHSHAHVGFIAGIPARYKVHASREKTAWKTIDQTLSCWPINAQSRRIIRETYFPINQEEHDRWLNATTSC